MKLARVVTILTRVMWFSIKLRVLRSPIMEFILKRSVHAVQYKGTILSITGVSMGKSVHDVGNRFEKQVSQMERPCIYNHIEPLSNGIVTLNILPPSSANMGKTIV